MKNYRKLALFCRWSLYCTYLLRTFTCTYVLSLHLHCLYVNLLYNPIHTAILTFVALYYS